LFTEKGDLPVLTIRNFKLQEMVFPMEVAFKEGWNPGLYDGMAFYQADPEGFFLAEQEGGMAGGISAVKYGHRLAFIGGHFVLPPFRGRGIGRALWEHALAAAGSRVVGVNGLPDGKGFYEAYGFKAAYNIIRYGGRIFPESRFSGDVCSAQDVDLGQLTAFDAGFFGASRGTFLKAWLAAPGLESACLLKEGQLQGWGCMRRCRQGWRLGPVFAQHHALAEEILRHLALKTIGESVYIDITEANVQSIRLAFAMGMIPWGARLRLYKGDQPPQPLDKIYGFTTLDIG
jgi:GNAT superfamily N-acetyltransferase